MFHTRPPLARRWLPCQHRRRSAADVVIFIVLTALFVPGSTGAGPTAPRKLLTVERIYADPPLTGQAPSGIRWAADSRSVTWLERFDAADGPATRLVAAAVPSGKRRTLCILDTIPVPEDLQSKDDDAFTVRSYQWAPRGEVALMRFRGEIFTVDARSGEVQRWTTSDAAESNVTFSPNGRWISFTRDNDLWAIDRESGTERRLTATGSDSLLNGVLDWVYMEELFTRGDVKGYWWSPDSRAIAFLQIDESPVRTFPIVDFVPAYNTAKMQHYPKAGAPIPIVRVGVFDFSTDEISWMNVDTTDDGYIARVYWLGDSRHVAIEKLNRDQNQLQLLFADAGSGEAREVLREERPTWVNITYARFYYEKGDRFLWNSERDGHSHLYLYKSDGTQLNAVTEGAWDVAELNDVDEGRGHVYFTGLKSSILERHLYRVSERGGRIRQVSQRPGDHRVTFSPDHRYYIDRFSSVEVPRVVSVHDATGKELFRIDEADVSELAEYDLPRPEFFTITSKDGLEFNCSMIKPPHLDPSRRYPVIVYTYGGPHAQVVRNRWGGTRYLWHAYMATRGYIIFSLDNRGSFGRGTAWEDPILENMGATELEDQIAGVEYLETLPYVDPSRIGIWGWSYGGYMTSMAMFKAPGVFRAGAAIAPVTDWHFYDTIYTERYMKHPEDNPEGYRESAPINFADGLQGAFFLAHGTADDNVHFANSVRLVHELIEAGKDFDLMIYPGKLHGITGDAARVHLFRRLTKFFDRHLLLEEPVSEVP